MAKMYFKTVIRVEVLTEDEPVPDGWSLADIEHEFVEGDWSGHVEDVEVKELTPQEAAKALLEQGSDPEFFGLDEEGNELNGGEEGEVCPNCEERLGEADVDGGRCLNCGTALVAEQPEG